MDVIDRVPGLGAAPASLASIFADERMRARAYTARARRRPARDRGLDLAPVADCRVASSSLNPGIQRTSRRRSSTCRTEPRLTAEAGRRGSGPVAAGVPRPRTGRPVGDPLDSDRRRRLSGRPRRSGSPPRRGGRRRGRRDRGAGRPRPAPQPDRRCGDHPRRRLPGAVHVAAFDTAFHATLPGSAGIATRCPGLGRSRALRVPRALGRLVRGASAVLLGRRATTCGSSSPTSAGAAR